MECPHGLHPHSKWVATFFSHGLYTPKSLTIRHVPQRPAAQIKRRTKQQLYRTKQLELWGHRCALIGCDIPELLIAGHAKPWADSAPAERIDPYNGFPLEARFDRLFDQGLISFADDGSILLSRALSSAQCLTLGLTPALHLRAPLHPRHLPYLRYHREHVFQG